jgi:peptidoglycan/LPS O-acetylase OafA/YrhL
MVTLLLVRVIPNHTFHVSPLGLIPSLTFLDPGLPNKFFHTQVFDWIDGSYWSLFVEVRFYFLAALLFYSRRNKFAGNVYLFGRIVLSLSLLAAVLHLERFGKVFDLFFIAQYLPWFLIGIAFFMLEKRVEQPFRDGLFLLGILSLLARAALDRSYLAAAMAVVIPLFFLAASSVSLVKRVLSQRLLTGVGAASYSLYLLHGYIGVALIGWLANFLRFRGEYSAVLAILTTVVVTIISQLIYTYWETPLDRFIVAKLKPKVSRVKAPDLPVAPAIEAHSAAFPLTIDDPVA